MSQTGFIMTKESRTPIKKKVLRVTIVGADGRKWKDNQEQKMKEYIEMQLFGLLHRRELIIGGIEFLQVKDIPEKWNNIYKTQNLEDWVLYNATCKPVEFDELVVVSGHCPVGEERWYNITDDRWANSVELSTHLYLRDNCSKVSVSGLNIKEKEFVKVFNQGGVDTWAEIIAHQLGIKTEIYPAEIYQWEDKKTNLMSRELVEKYPNDFEKQFVKLKGFRSRNIQIAEACDILYDIEPSGKCRHCGGIGHIASFIFKNSQVYQKPCKYCEGDGAYSGGTWTLKHARKLGKEVHKVIIE